MRRALAATLEPLHASPGLTLRVASGPVEYAAVGFDRLGFNVQAVAGLAGDEDAENLLDELIARDGARSVKTLLEADPELGGLVSDTAVVRCTGWQLYRQGDHDAIGATWTVHTLT